MRPARVLCASIFGAETSDNLEIILESLSIQSIVGAFLEKFIYSEPFSKVVLE